MEAKRYYLDFQRVTKKIKISYKNSIMMSQNRVSNVYTTRTENNIPQNGMTSVKAQVSHRSYRNMNIEQFNRNIVTMRDELVATAIRLSGNSETAEDLVQEVMLKLWSMRSELDRHTCPKALALTILRNKFYDGRRHARHEMTVTHVQQDHGKEDTTVETADEMDVIRRIMDSLPPLQSQILRMKEIDGYDKEEIMKITGCTPESLRQNLSRARRRIKEEFMRITAYNAMHRG